MVSTSTTFSQAQYKQQFQQLDADQRLAALWYIYDSLGETTIESPDDNKESDSSVALYDKLKAASKDEQLQFMRDVLSERSNDLTNAYAKLSNTTKVALWYRLGEGMSKGSVVQVPADYQLSGSAKDLVSKLSEIDFEQRYIFIRDVLLGK